MYLLILNVLKKPSNIIILGLSLLLSFCFINSQLKDIKIAKLNNEIVDFTNKINQLEELRKAEKNLYQHNIEVVKEAFTELQIEMEKLRNIIKQKNIELSKQNERIEYWKKLYVDKPCVNNNQEVVKPSKGIINDETNITVVNSINSIFGF